MEAGLAGLHVILVKKKQKLNFLTTLACQLVAALSALAALSCQGIWQDLVCVVFRKDMDDTMVILME